MKNLIKTGLFLAAFAMIAFSFSSCTEDDSEVCYECDAYEIEVGGVTIPIDAISICEGDPDGNGGTYTEDTLMADIEVFEAAGADCRKK